MHQIPVELLENPVELLENPVEIIENPVEFLEKRRESKWREIHQVTS